MGKQPTLYFHANALLFILGTLSLYFCFNDDILSANMSVALVALIWITALACLALRTENGFFSLPVGYLLVLGIFHLGMIIPLSIGFKIDVTDSWPFYSCLPKSLNLCATAFAFYGASALSYNYNTAETENIRTQHKLSDRTYNTTLRFLLIGGLILGTVGACLLSIGMWRLNLFHVTYSESYMLRLDNDPRLFGTGYLFMLMGMVISGSAASARQIKWIAIISVLVFGPLFLYGFRGHLIVYFMALLSIWYRKDSKFAKKIGCVALAAVILLAPTIKVLRDSRDLTFSEAIRDVSFLDFVIEAGGSLRPLVEIVNQIDFYDNPYWYGASYWTGVTRIIPNLNPDWTRADSVNAYVPSAWITERVDPYTFAKAGGMGSSGIAEPYLNFGPLGVVLFFSLAGYLLMKYEHASKANPYHCAVLMCAYASLLWTCRNDFTEFCRPTGWAFVFMTVISFFVKLKLTTASGNTITANQTQTMLPPLKEKSCA